MNRLKKTFEEKKGNLLSIYYTAGYPAVDDTMAIAEALEAAGADFLEIGIPYSDPVADGPVIQHSSQAALDNGMTVKLLFSQLKDLREKLSIPVLLMGYINPILQFGMEKFCQACAETGIDGIIVPDLPMFEYERYYKEMFDKYGISNIFLVTPFTSEERIRKIDALSTSFIYLVSSSATTGKNLQVSHDTESYFARIAAMNLNNKLMVGFGISDALSFNKAAQYANGAIIGSAFVKLLGESDYLSKIEKFIPAIRQADTTIATS